jgi:hypothetical protein
MLVGGKISHADCHNSRPHDVSNWIYSRSRVWFTDGMPVIERAPSVLGCMAGKGYVLVPEDQVDQKAAELAALNAQKQQATAPSPAQTAKR